MVVKDYLKWIKKTVKEASAAENLKYYPGRPQSKRLMIILINVSVSIIVLVAHMGVAFHFRLMAAEMARHKLSFKKRLKGRRVKFADSLECLREVCNAKISSNHCLYIIA